jgi:hypothetical protein
MAPRFKGKPNFDFSLPCPFCGYKIQPRADASGIAHHPVPEVRRSIRRDGWPETHQYVLNATLPTAGYTGVPCQASGHCPSRHVINNYALFVLKRTAEAPERCGRCRSYKITVDWHPELGRNGLYIPRCEACGATKLPRAKIAKHRCKRTS